MTLRDAVDMATINPARIIHLEGRMKGLVAGERADLVLFHTGPEAAVDAVYVDGERAAD